MTSFEAPSTNKELVCRENNAWAVHIREEITFDFISKKPANEWKLSETWLLSVCMHSRKSINLFRITARNRIWRKRVLILCPSPAWLSMKTQNTMDDVAVVLYGWLMTRRRDPINAGHALWRRKVDSFSADQSFTHWRSVMVWQTLVSVWQP